MSSRKRHLLALLLALVPLAGLLLLWLKWPHTHQTPSQTAKVVPVHLSEIAPAAAAQPAPSRAQARPDPSPPAAPPKAVEQAAAPVKKPSKPRSEPARPKPVKTKPAKAPKRPETKPVNKAAKPQPAHKPRRSTPPRPATPRKPAEKPLRKATPERPRASTPTRRQLSPTLPDMPDPLRATRLGNTPAAPAQPASKPSSKPAVDAGLKRRYLERLRATIARLARDSYPYRARRRGQEGTVVLRFTVHADGRISALHQLSGSGHRLLDEAARDVIEAQMGMRFEPFPAGLNLDQIQVTIPIRYRLR